MNSHLPAAKHQGRLRMCVVQLPGGAGHLALQEGPQCLCLTIKVTPNSETV